MYIGIHEILRSFKRKRSKRKNTQGLESFKLFDYKSNMQLPFHPYVNRKWLSLKDKRQKDKKEWNNVLNPRRCQSLTFRLATKDKIEILDTNIH